MRLNISAIALVHIFPQFLYNFFKLLCSCSRPSSFVGCKGKCMWVGQCSFFVLIWNWFALYQFLNIDKICYFYFVLPVQLIYINNYFYYYHYYIPKIHIAWFLWIIIEFIFWLFSVFALWTWKFIFLIVTSLYLSLSRLFLLCFGIRI